MENIKEQNSNFENFKNSNMEPKKGSKSMKLMAIAVFLLLLVLVVGYAVITFNNDSPEIIDVTAGLSESDELDDIEADLQYDFREADSEFEGLEEEVEEMMVE